MINCKYKVGDVVRIINERYLAYYGFANSILIVKATKLIESDNYLLDGKFGLNLITFDGKSIEDEFYNPIFVNEDDVDYYLSKD